MTIKYLGVKGKVQSQGCPVCGSKRKTSMSMEYSKSVTFPNGNRKVFLINQTYNVTQEEGEFLLRMKYDYAGQELHPFALV